MRKSTIEAVYSSSIKKVWDTVTNNKEHSWRSDIVKLEVMEDESCFTEHTKDGFQTDFKITCKKEHERYEFDMKNKNMEGHWIGKFEETETGGTKIIFTEELHIRNPIIELLSYIAMPLKKIQETYAKDLKKALGEE